jgi:hypothetical protein
MSGIHVKSSDLERILRAVRPFASPAPHGQHFCVSPELSGWIGIHPSQEALDLLEVRTEHPEQVLILDASRLRREARTALGRAAP